MQDFQIRQPIQPANRAMTTMLLEQLRELLQHTNLPRKKNKLDIKLNLAIYHEHRQETVQIVKQFCEENKLVVKKRPISIFYSQKIQPTLRQILECFQKPEEIPRFTFMNPVPKDLHKVLDNIYGIFGYIPSLERLLIMFPTYLKNFVQLNSLLMQSQHCPVEQVEVYMIAIMAVSCYGSLFLFRRLVKRFRQIGGDIKWLKGQMPSRINQLKKLNNLLAYSPWALQQKCFEQIRENTKYNLHQMIYIITTMSLYHSLACFSLASGLIVQQQIQQCQKYIELSELKQYPLWRQSLNEEKQVKMSFEKLFSLREMAEEFEIQKKQYEQTAKLSQTKLISHSQEWSSSAYMKTIDKQIKSQETYKKISKAFEKYLDSNYYIERYDTAKFSYLEHSEFDFKFGTFVFISDIDSRVANCLSQLIQYTKTMTNHAIGNKISSTESFRKAIRFYYENLSGYRHQDYNYRKNMTDYLSKEIKFYIKVATYYPFLMENSVLYNMPHEGCFLNSFDTVHICLLAINTKFQLAMTMATRVLKKIKEKKELIL